MSNYKLLTPGPLTTTEAVKREMLKDRCTWDDDYKNVTQVIRKQLLKLAQVDEHDYTTVLMQGSGSFVVESVLTTAIGENDKVLILTNGAYGERIVEMAKVLKLQHVVYSVPYDEQPSSLEVQAFLESDASITILGDVNPGAKVISGGNIVVLGALKGNAQAGIYGNSDCFILALEMDPIQIRIGELIAKSPDKQKTKRRFIRKEKTESNELQIAVARDGNIYIEPVSKKILSNI